MKTNIVSTLIPKENKISKYILYLISIIYVLYIIIYPPINIICWDVFGYYLYLPFTFIHNDIGLTNQTKLNEIINTYHNTVTFYQADMHPNGNWVIRYSSGLAIMYSPSFLVGHIGAKLFGCKADGFSAPYQISLLYGSLFFSLLGLRYLRKILLEYFSDIITSFVLIIIVFGTNYFIHTGFFGQGAMSHNYLFTLYAALVWFTIRFYKSPSIKLAIILGIVEALMVLIRPSEIISLLIPLLWGISSQSTFKSFFSFLLKEKLKIVVFAIALIGICSIQLFYWKYLTGKWLVYSYGGNNGEGFEFFSPFTIEFLFSFRKGWFIYTPIMIFSVIGLYHLKKLITQGWVAIIAYFVITMYIITSWSCWWYAGSYSQRAMIPSYPILALGLGAFIKTLITARYKLVKLASFFFIGIFVLLNLFQSWQFFNGFIDDSRMSYTYYWKIFGKTNVTNEDRKYLLIGRPADGIEKFSRDDSYNHRLDKTLILSFEDTIGISKKILDTNSFCGDFSQLVVMPIEFSKSIETPFYQLTNKHYAWLKISCMVYPKQLSENTNACLATTFKYNNKWYKYKELNLKDTSLHLKLNQWNKISTFYLTPDVRTTNDKFETFFWNRSADSILVDDLKIEVYEPNIDP